MIMMWSWESLLEACSEFELLEDEVANEVYIGLVGRSEPQAARAPETNLEDKLSTRQEDLEKTYICIYKYMVLRRSI